MAHRMAAIAFAVALATNLRSDNAPAAETTHRMRSPAEKQHPVYHPIQTAPQRLKARDYASTMNGVSTRGKREEKSEDGETELNAPESAIGTPVLSPFLSFPH